MHKGRMEAFSDGVLAIIITIMVLELEAPHETTPQALLPIMPVFLGYVLSFAYVGIYWNNHHHLLQTAKETNGRVLWANMLLLFFLSLIPFATAWMGRTHFAAWPMLLYATVLLMAGLSYYVLVRALISLHGSDSTLARAVGKDNKGKISLVLYLLAMATALIAPLLAGALLILVAVMWLIPDRRIENELRRA
ncbi:MAG: TMEM175 family protein [Caldilineales bacterium]